MSHKATWQTDCIRTLNELSGCSAAPPPKERNSTQARCLDQLQNTFDHQAFPGDEQAGEALLGLASGAYAVGPSQCGPTAPYAKAKVAWPALGSRPVLLDTLLREADSSRYYGFTSQMLRPASEAEQLMNESLISPHTDAILRHDRQAYAEFPAGLSMRGLIRWKRQPSNFKATLGVFFVAKKDGSLRVVFDTRRANLQFHEPPSTNFPTAGAFASLDTDDQSHANIVHGDISNAFYNMAIPTELSELFTLPSAPYGLVANS